MGYSLISESELTSVLYCRDKLLAKGGLIFSDEISLNLGGIQDYNHRDGKVKWWKNEYEFSMTYMIRCDMAQIGKLYTDIKEIFVNIH
ncbi:hypothetical protein A3Q56_08212 [Intoshia linei]|uniref:Uncharacterized protein n=1 Tax=Intoshia linei TaxID=1819745 RepID=A0A177ARD9_9BILA|nr:hypothetical protein A3Q56_08212 [Intoshia linei]